MQTAHDCVNAVISYNLILARIPNYASSKTFEIGTTSKVQAVCTGCPCRSRSDDPSLIASPWPAVRIRPIPANSEFNTGHSFGASPGNNQINVAWAKGCVDLVLIAGQVVEIRAVIGFNGCGSWVVAQGRHALGRRKHR